MDQCMGDEPFGTVALSDGAGSIKDVVHCALAVLPATSSRQGTAFRARSVETLQRPISSLICLAWGATEPAKQAAVLLGTRWAADCRQSIDGTEEAP